MPKYNHHPLENNLPITTATSQEPKDASAIPPRLFLIMSVCVERSTVIKRQYSSPYCLNFKLEWQFGGWLLGVLGDGC
eukprot:scaffold24345_cov64-Attheya_sp.AAC.9